MTITDAYLWKEENYEKEFKEQAVSMSENTAGFVWMDFQYKPLILILISRIYIVLVA